MNGKEMKLEEAVAIVAQACAMFQGTLKDHQTIQQALQVIEQALKVPALVADGEGTK
jgi:hypothetical protein